MSNIITIYPSGCARFDNVVYSFCLPIKEQCGSYVPQGLLSECDADWNCARGCNGNEYYLPATGKIMFQTQIQSSDAIGAQYVDVAGSITSAPVSFSSNIKFVQTIEIDLDEIPETCFKIQLTVGERVVCSQWFKKPTCGAGELVTFEGIHTGKDCYGNDYKNTGFSNKVTVEGTFKYYGGSIDETGTPTEIYRFHPSKKIPPFLMQYLLNVIFTGKQIKVNGEMYDFEGSGALTPTKSGMFFPIFDFGKTCNGVNNKCD